MKLKSIALLIMVGALTLLTSLPVAAATNDMSNNSQNNKQTVPVPTDNTVTTENTVTNQSNDLLNNMQPQNDNIDNRNNEISPDTVTGDDDY